MIVNRRRRQRKGEPPPDILASWSPEARTAYALARKQETPIVEMGLPVRIVNALEDLGVIYAGEVVRKTKATLLTVESFGDKTIDEISAAVARLGLPVPEDWARKIVKKRRKYKKRP